MARGRQKMIGVGAIVAALVLALASWSPGAAHAVLTAHIHPGTCADLGAEPAFELGELGYVAPLLDLAAATPAGPYQQIGAADALPTVMLATEIEATLDELLAEPYALDVHIIDDEAGVDVLLACGGIGGVRFGDDLVFGVESAPDAGVDTTGIAWLHANPDDTTTLRLFVAQGLAPGGYGAFEATPEP